MVCSPMDSYCSHRRFIGQFGKMMAEAITSKIRSMPRKKTAIIRMLMAKTISLPSHRLPRPEFPIKKNIESIGKSQEKKKQRKSNEEDGNSLASLRWRRLSDVFPATLFIKIFEFQVFGSGTGKAHFGTRPINSDSKISTSRLVASVSTRS